MADHWALAPRLLRVEGGARDIGLAATRHARSGGRAVARLCGTPGCQRRAARSQQPLIAAGLRTVRRHVPGAGHVYWGPLVSGIAQAFAQLTRDDTRWASPAPIPRAEASLAPR